MKTIVINKKSLSSLHDVIEFYGLDITVTELLDFENNRRNIFSQYSFQEKQNYGSANQNLVKPQTLLNIPDNSALLTRVENDLEYDVKPNSPFLAFFDDRIKSLINSSGYRKTFLKNPGKGVAVKDFPKFTVLAWSRQRGDILLNLTPFVNRLSTNNAKNGGNFNLGLQPLMGEWTNGWNPKDLYFFNQDNFYAKGSTVFSENGNIVSSTLYFDKILSTNDVILIQFEKLELESTRKELNTLEVPINYISGKTFDFMGLIDTVNSPIDYSQNTSSVSIVGRCFTKILIEDGNYFYPVEYINGSIFANNSNNKRVDRIFGTVNDFNVYIDRDIEFSLKFIFDKLSNIEITSDELFNYTGSSKKGIWKSIVLSIDPEVSDRRIVDTSIATTSGSLLNFVNKVCQEPFVEFFSDTYGDKFYFIVRKPPTDYESYLSLVEMSVKIEPEDVFNVDLTFDDSEAYSWYRLTPQGAFLGNGSQFALAYIPAIFFPEYAEIWGSKPLDIVTNYINFSPILEKEKSQNKRVDYLENQAFEDLRYVIESNAYKPFTRKGQIVLNGDRRLKKGQAIRLSQTGEVFHVVSVTQTSSISEAGIERQTLVEVERGMILRHFDKYFKIVSFDSKTKQIPKKPKNKVFEFTSDLFFDKGKSVLIINSTEFSNDNNNRQNLIERTNKSLEKLLSFIKDNDVIDIVIEGHTDSDSGAQANLRLSKNRAGSLKAELLKTNPGLEGITKTVGFGESRPIVANDTPENKSKNRRVEVVLKYKEKADSGEFVEKKEIDWKVNKDIFQFFINKEQFI